MRRGLVLGVGTALAFVGGFSVFAVPPAARPPEPIPARPALEAVQEDVAELQVLTPALPERERRNAEKLLAEAARRLDGAQELVLTVNPRIAKYLQKEAKLAKTRVEQARKIVEQGGTQ